MQLPPKQTLCVNCHLPLFSTYSRIVQLPCSHWLHESCWLEWEHQCIGCNKQFFPQPCRTLQIHKLPKL